MSSPIAVLISDIHFNLNTLSLASKSLQLAIEKAIELKIPLIIAGDLQDTKAIIRGEVANKIIDLVKYVKIPIYLLVGNHDLINEKGSEHSLNYLKPYIKVVENLSYVPEIAENLYLLPYQNSTEELKEKLKLIPDDSIVIVHQGFLGAYMGDYVQDKTSLDPKEIEGRTVISGHYHRHQVLGKLTYIGSPYTITFGEANDGPKGFLILNSNGSIKRNIINLRKHIIVELNHTDKTINTPISSEDLVWIKINGPLSELKKIKKQELGLSLFGHSNFKLDLIPSDSSIISVESKNITDPELFDTIIDATGETSEQKVYLKSLWRNLLED